MHAIWGSWGRQMHKMDLKRRVSNIIIDYIPFHVHETVLGSAPCTIEGSKRQEKRGIAIQSVLGSSDCGERNACSTCILCSILLLRSPNI